MLISGVSVLCSVIGRQNWQLPLNEGTGEPDTRATETIALTDGFVFEEGLFNSNGIEVIQCATSLENS